MTQQSLFPEEGENKKPKPKKKDHEHGFYSFMVKAFLLDEKKTTFIFQYKQAKKLFTEIPEKKFWQWLVGEGKKVYSLKEWLKPEELQLLRHLNKKRKLKLPKPKQYNLEKDVIGKDKKALKYKTNLIDFIDNE
tara:strand:- start:381 stop:782 length:402 start_codon:yes stop_codon:yes gene_type:complete